MFKRLFLFLSLSLAATLAAADIELPAENWMIKQYIEDEKLLLADARMQDSRVKPMTSGATFKAPSYKRRWLTTNRLHQYLGFATIAAATTTILVPKPEDDHEAGVEPHDHSGSTHQTVAEITSYLAYATSASGLVFHIKDLNYSRGFWKDPDNLHALLGALGTTGIALAVKGAGDESHAGFGIAGYSSMLFAIKLVW